MKSNNLFRIIEENKSLLAIKEIEFSEFNFKERYNIQEWVESNPSILGEELLIISKENSFFDNTGERPDLIALDRNGNIVVIELKRDDSGTNLEWQAIKHASYLSKFTVNDIINMTAKYFLKKKEVQSLETIKQKFLEFIDEDNLDDINKKQRIVLVSHRFAKEVTSAVNWLINKYEVDVRCVQLIPFFDKDKSSCYIQSSTILPVAGVDDLLISAAKNQEKANSNGYIEKRDDITAIFMNLYEKLKDELGSLLPEKESRWAGTGNKYRYLHLWYLNSNIWSNIWSNWGLSYRIWLYQNHSEYNSNIVIRLEGDDRHLLSNGLTEGSLKSLKDNMKKLKDSDYNYYERNVYFGIEKIIENDEVKIISSFKNLVETTKPFFDNII